MTMNDPSDSCVEVDIDGKRVRALHSPSGVAKFLGIPFAKVTQRFSLAKRIDFASLGPKVDATNFGPRCPQSFNHGPQRRKHLYRGASLPPQSPPSERDCLNLNVYTPVQALSEKSKLPVLVWIHGGGWVFGDGGSEYDGTFLVQEASRIGSPFIFVALNYRLGYYGFLSSRELRMEAEARNEEYCPNLGLHDQCLALQWVQDNIANFGGDPSQVTVAGQSAGPWSALSHLVTDRVLCKRGLIMSATVISFPTESENQEIFDKLVARAGLAPGDSAQEKLAALRNLTDEQMTTWLDGAVLIRPCWDATWFSALDGPSRLDEIRSLPDWVEGIVIGSTKDETANIRPLWASFQPETILGAVESVVPEQSMSDEIAQTYGIASTSHEHTLNGLLDLTTESFFGLFPKALGQLRAPVSVYQFEQPDTFEESNYRDKAYHCLDLPFLCRMPAVAGTHADSDMRLTSDALTVTISTFVCGKQPWEPFHRSQKVMVFKGRESGMRQWPADERWRRFFDTPGRSRVLVDTGRLVMTYDVSQLV